MLRSRCWARSSPYASGAAGRGPRWSTPPASGSASSTWASTTSSTSSAGQSLPARRFLGKTGSPNGGNGVRRAAVNRSWLRPPDLLHDGAGQLVGIVVGRDPRVYDVHQHRVDAALVHGRRVVDDSLDAGRLGRCRQREIVVAVDYHEVEDVGSHVTLDGFEVVADPKRVRLAGLGRDVANKDLDRGRGLKRLGHPVDDEVRQDAGVEASGADDDHLGVQDRLFGFRVDGGFRLEEDAFDCRGNGAVSVVAVGVGNARLAYPGLTVGHLSHQGDVA